MHQRVYGLTGTLNTAGSTVRKVFGARSTQSDGSAVSFTYQNVTASIAWRAHT